MSDIGTPVGLAAYTIEEFCHAHRLCRATFYNLIKQKTGPAVMKVGGRTYVSIEAATAWRRRMEGATDASGA